MGIEPEIRNGGRKGDDNNLHSDPAKPGILKRSNWPSSASQAGEAVEKNDGNCRDDCFVVILYQAQLNNALYISCPTN